MIDLFFEKTISRRSFLKTCTALALGTVIAPHLLPALSDQKSIAGFTEPFPALFYKTLPNHAVQCQLCPRYCVVKKGQRGFCRVRENRDGAYYTLAYANPCAVHIDPIEKKPLFHFLPGTQALSIATAGCNFTCKNCQNWDISQARPEDTYNLHVTPDEMVALALKYKTPTIAYTYTEPTVFFEYMLATAKCAQKKNIRNVYHSNGYINPEPLKEMIPYLDGANIDLKAMNNDFYTSITSGTLDPVLETLVTLKKNGVWLEITNLIIPTKNDSLDMIENMCVWIRDRLGKDTPVHFSRFYPYYKLQNLPPTPISTLQNAADIAHTVGLQYVYIGNVPGIEEENTFCPHCDRKIIERKGYRIDGLLIKNGKCKSCNTSISGVWH